MTLASKITLIRVAFIPLYMVLMYMSGGAPGLWMWLALAVFIIASLTDYVDGQIARKCNQVSDFGKFLDPLADKLLTIAAMFFLNIGVLVWSLHLDARFMRLEREVQKLRERSIRLEEQRFQLGSHSRVVEELARRGIAIQDPVRPAEKIE